MGVGLGPSNLSLAALAEPVHDLRAVFLERRPFFEWHPGLMFSHARTQTSFLKDLVTLVDPTSRHSFLNFLAESGRLYRFLVVDSKHVSRREYAQYCDWVARRLESIRFNAPVEEIDFRRGRFEIRAGGDVLRSRHVVLATGRMPSIPAVAAPFLGDDVLHAAEFLPRCPPVEGRRVLVVGGGQTGAEVVFQLIGGDALPQSLVWASSRHGFLPLDDSPFTNEWFNPSYVAHFHSLDEERRRELVERQLMASNGISVSLLEQLYRRLYELDFVEEAPLDYRLLPSHRLVGLRRKPEGVVAELQALDTAAYHELAVDLVVLGTGYDYRLPSFLEPLRDRLLRDGRFAVRADYGLEWDGPGDCGIYVQNASTDAHGIADANLSLTAWRSATILNAICGREVYATARESVATTWELPRAPVAPLVSVPGEAKLA